MEFVKQKISKMVRSWEGPLTSELTQSPGKFGLGKLPSNIIPDNVVNMTCGFCSTGCSLDIHLQGKETVNITPDVEYPVNLGMACPKGWEALTPLSAPDRGTTPLLRNQKGQMEPVDWEEAMQVFVLRLKAIQEQHGPESIAWLGTGQIVTEELALLGAVAKFGMGIIHGDANTRQCMATSVVAYKESFGFDAPPFTYADFEESDVIFLIGSNLCIAHPILWQRILRNKNSPEIIVIDPRRTETALAATQHVALRPKSDLLLLYGIAKVLVENGWVEDQFIADHTSGFPEFISFLQSISFTEIAGETGLDYSEIYRLADVIHNGKKVSFWWTMGVNQSHEATRTAQAIINLALMTGNIGRPGTGANSITGQCNAMGSRLFSNTTSLFAGRDFTKPDHRKAVARILNIHDAHIPALNSLPYHKIIESVQAGKIKALWVIGTNPAHSWIDQPGLKEALSKLELLVVQDMYFTTESNTHAHIYFPAAGWGEKDGTFINSERRIGLVKKVARAPGQALSDFNIFRLVAHYWGCSDLLPEWTSPEAVFQVLKRFSAGQPCDFTGIQDYHAIDRAGGIQWPLPEGAITNEKERRLFADGCFFHSDGRARFVFERPRKPSEPTSSQFPLILLTGRGSSAQWHTQSRTSKSTTLRRLYRNAPFIEINPADAETFHIRDGQQVQVQSSRGNLTAAAVVTQSVKQGEVYIPMHYECTNKVTFPQYDPYSHQPSYKHTPVNISPL